jgi:hypothetical protein
MFFVFFAFAARPSWFIVTALAQQAPRSARVAAPVDLTGVWVSVITEDWRWRMVTAPKGDYPGVPLNAAGEKLANEWDPARDISAGEQCRAYGAAGVMRLPTRVRISWENDTTLKLETDAGQQVRRLQFAGSAARGAVAGSAARDPAYTGEATWQGVSVARWETMNEGQGQAPGGGGGGGGQQGAQAQGPALSGSLAVETTHLRAGYLRRNGVPYSSAAVLAEFFDRTSEPNGDTWLIVTSIVDDPTYLTQPFMLTTHFKKEPDASKWNPRPCEVTSPVNGK